jgi:splicing factor 3B subunit 1
MGETPRRSRWDETPVVGSGGEAFGATPAVTSGAATPSQTETYGAMSGDLAARNRPLSDEELDQLLPAQGYKILEPPATYKPIHTPARKLTATPAPMSGTDGFYMQQEDRKQHFDVPVMPPQVDGEELPMFKPEDIQFFGKLLDQKPDEDLTLEEAKERKIMRMLIRIKNGTPQMRKISLRHITEKAREFGAGPMFNQILPLLMSPTLEDQERYAVFLFATHV